MAVDYNAVFGVKPIVPNLDEAQRQALLANLGNFDDLAALGSRTSGANQAQVLQQMMAADPLFKQNLALQSQTINDQLNARLPDAARRYLSQVAAEGNLALGTQGSPFGANRQVSLAQENILPWMQQGVTNANAFRTNVSGTATAPPWDVSKGFISAEDQAQRNLLAANVAAAPQPGARGAYEEGLAREFFNRTEAAGAPRQGAGTGGGGRATAPNAAPVYYADAASIAGRSGVGGAIPPPSSPPRTNPYDNLFQAGRTLGPNDLSNWNNWELSNQSFSDQFSGIPYQAPQAAPGFSGDYELPYRISEPNAGAGYDIPFDAQSPFSDFGLNLGTSPQGGGSSWGGDAWGGEFSPFDYGAPVSQSGAPLATIESIMAYLGGDDW